MERTRIKKEDAANRLRSLIEFGPLVLFFITNFFLRDILIATAVLVAATVLAIGYSYFTMRRIPMLLAFGASAVVLFGTLTLVFDNAVFIKIKPTVVSLIIASVMVVLMLFGRNPVRMLMRHVMDYEMPAQVWRRLNLIWIGMFLAIAIANEWAWRNLTTDGWVTFKVFGLTGISLVFGAAIAVILAKHGGSNRGGGGKKSGGGDAA